MFTPLADSIIRFREFAIHQAFQIPAKEVLNPRTPVETPQSSISLVQQIGQSVNQFKQEAMDETGAHVNYPKLRQTDSYRNYTRNLAPQLKQLELSDLADRETATAFWINLYNALVIHAVIEFGVQDSIALGGISDQVRFFRKAAYNIGRQRFSLEDIEHGILRANRGNPFQFSPQIPPNDPRFDCIIQPVDPRIHFALNCASVSCPPISVYDPQKLDQQLDLASANYIDHETRLTPKGLSISKLFSWYKKDFGTDREVAEFLLSYLPDDARKTWLEDNFDSPRFSYLPYDWGLNI